ncbi:MAG: TIM44-like domain-containing protein [Taibaiella sp.]|nr:TIM44-like domain-containing protein [Taibaiella sp.]
MARIRSVAGTRVLLRVIFIFTTVLSSELVHARRWRWRRTVGLGHSRHVGSDPVQLFFAVLVILGAIAFAIVVAYRRVKASANLKASAKQDPIWDKTQLEQIAFNAFCAIQNAWVARDMSSVREMVTNEFYERYTSHFDMNRKDGIHNIVEDAEVNKVIILRTEDFKDDSRDGYSAYIAGFLRDYTVSDITGKVIRNVDKQLSEFADIYYFIRSGDKWLLREIDTEADDLDMAVSRNYREK